MHTGRLYFVYAKIHYRFTDDIEKLNKIMNTILYSSTVIIWGTTWLAIYWQLGDVPVVVSVFYRFALAALLLLPPLLLFKKDRITRFSDHRYLFLLGACLFCFNFICFYNATRYIPSGLVSVIFSLATVYNAINSRIFFAEKIPGNVILAAAIGFSGLVLLFWNEVQSQNEVTALIPGIALAALGTLFFSFGNMLSRRNSQAGISPMTANAWGMFYGSLILLLIITLSQTPFVVPTDGRYFSALIYLSVFGSIIAFTTYLSLIVRIGANRAAYATVMFPVIALSLSTIYEGYSWVWTSYTGLVFILLGNVLINYKPKVEVN